MNDPLHQLETELHQLAPAPLPARVQRRLDEIGAAAPWYVVRWPVWSTALATTAVAVALLSLPATPPSSGPRKTTVARVADCPPSVLRVLCSERDEGVVLVNQTTPYRQTRRRYVDLYTWDHCLPGARLDYSKPAEEVVFTPITVY
jgi:hypothetical protein